MDEIEYLTVKTFCSKHRYPITLKMLILCEKELHKKCEREATKIKVTKSLGTDLTIIEFPRWVLEEYFLLWIK